MPIATTITRRCIFTLTLTLGACAGDDDDDTGADSNADSTSDATNSTTAATASTTTPAEDSGSGDESSGPSESTGADGSTGAAVCATDICATYGAAVPTVAGQITDAAAADPQFEAFFAPLVAEGPAAVDAFKASLAAFISDAYGCSEGAYTGPTMEVAHTGMAITQEQYDAFIGLIAGILEQDMVPADDINLCFAPALVDPAFANTIIGQ
jgi:truncated hemoglobin YjbI